MINNEVKSIIFDLDGTLVDSSESVLDSIKRALSICNIQPLKPLNSELIGPPLVDILKVLSGESDEAVLGLLAEQFKKNYDTVGFKKTAVFNGINEMLNELKDNGFKLYIATNKRKAPTKKIINYLGWDGLFEAVYSLDSFSPSLLSKKEILGKIITTHNLSRKDVIYVGDLDDDRVSAQANNIEYIIVSWGYGKKNISKDAINLGSTNELLVKLLNTL